MSLPCILIELAIGLDDVTHHGTIHETRFEHALVDKPLALVSVYRPEGRMYTFLLAWGGAPH